MIDTLFPRVILTALTDHYNRKNHGPINATDDIESNFGYEPASDTVVAII